MAKLPELETATMKMIVGLGNPGKKYNNTRHNIGFMVLDSLLEKKDARFKKRKNYWYCQLGDTLFLKPRTYMNLSGIAVLEARKKYSPTSLLVICDDIYIPLGKIRIREKGSDGGHNGLKSIIEATGEANFTRMRVGIGNPVYSELSDYVLAPFNADELSILAETKDFACRLTEQFIIGNYKQLVDYFSKNNLSYSGRIKELSESKTKGGNE
jgi:PTH1 family peptidyl-tRNA hydrolase